MKLKTKKKIHKTQKDDLKTDKLPLGKKKHAKMHEEPTTVN